MERKKISSANLRSVGYDESTQTLEIEFVDGSVCQYSRVPREIHRRLMAASSAGSYFKDNIEEEYSMRRVR